MNPRRGFTLIELLAVIAVLGLLAAKLLPALNRGKGGAERAFCASSMRQWGIALGAYAGDCGNYFPDNRDGKGGPCCCGTTVQNFWTNYLVPLVRSGESNKTHVLFCSAAISPRRPSPLMKCKPSGQVQEILRRCSGLGCWV